VSFKSVIFDLDGMSIDAPSDEQDIRANHPHPF
jgi:hypothetical protein